MKWAYQIGNKPKAIAGLCTILLTILLGHISYRNDFARIQHSVTSIYKDRLMPATYLYNIANHVYEKKILAENRHSTGSHYLQQQLRHDAAIADLIHSYEKTYLTTEEKKTWQLFKQQLAAFSAQTSPLGSIIPVSVQSDAAFHNTIHALNTLCNIQAGEGNNIRNSSKAIVNSTVITTYLEAALLIVLGLFTIIILGTTDKALFKQQQQQIWN